MSALLSLMIIPHQLVLLHHVIKMQETENFLGKECVCLETKFISRQLKMSRRYIYIYIYIYICVCVCVCVCAYNLRIFTLYI